ncbi:glycosyltransferase family 2 protein [Streptomyces narbonensis]|uniref:Glycosyltransferase family 2 protein n=1 Tax=Streptomyces narbonensis TaxID=67333 RepID=A0ABV3CCN1_9ACTN
MTGVAVRPLALSGPLPVVDIDLAEPGAFRRPGGAAWTRPTGRALGLVRLHGRPVAMAEASCDGPEELWEALAASARREFPLDEGTPARPPQLVGAPAISVIVATRNRARMLRDCLDSLLAVEYPRFEVIVVDNAPSDTSTQELVRREYGGSRRGSGPAVRYLREPVPGLARAHNRGLTAARGAISAFTDDDTLVDPLWLTALAAPFLADPGTGCVTGLIVPAELDTEAQIALERHGAFGKGYAPRTWSLRAPPDDPLFPFTAGRFGSGANMAFRTELLHELGGFDPATGVGTPAHGGDDLLSFFRVLAHGRALAYEPAAIVWHRHRRTPEALDAQAFGYGAGFGAYLAGALVHEPRMLPALLRRLPGGVRYVIARNRERAVQSTGPKPGQSTGPKPGPMSGPTSGPKPGPMSGPKSGPSRLARLELRGLLYGPYGYLRSRLIERRLRRRTGTAHRHGDLAAPGPRRRGASR